MRDTLLLIVALGLLISLLSFAFVKRRSLSGKIKFLLLGSGVLIIVCVFSVIKLEKVESEIARLIRNSRTRSADEVYSILFRTTRDSCVRVVNFKNQVIPKIDCCVWMELNTCGRELSQLLQSKNYEHSIVQVVEVDRILQSFPDRPEWWNLKMKGDTVLRSFVKFNSTNQQTLFYSSDSTHIFICDQAL